MVKSPDALIDFHCHLARCGGLPAIDPGAQQKLHTGSPPPRVVAVTNTVAEWRSLSATGQKERVVWGLGFHPGELHTYTDLKEFLQAVPEAAVIGEVGLDFRRSTPSHPKEQCRTLEAILDRAEGMEKIISLHSVRAGEEIVECLTGRHLPGAVLHWFLADESVIDRAIDLDLFFSVNPAMLRSQRGKDALQAMPPNRVLLETDAPYGINGNKAPIDIASALESLLPSIARTWRVPVDEVRARINSNQSALLKRAPVRSWS